ncbi:MAG: glutaminase A [Hyphomonadaceae bacterium]
MSGLLSLFKKRTRAPIEKATQGTEAPHALLNVEEPIQLYLQQLLERIRPLSGGAVASYIPELAKANPAHFAISVATLDGQVYAVGDSAQSFSIQSVSKPFVYGAALERWGRERVLKQVGVEPTGEAFNSIVLDDVNNRPFNPMVNAGAIAAAELIDGANPPARVRAMEALFARLAGRKLTMDEAVYRSEKETGHRNRAIAYMMLNSGMLSRDPEEILDLYFRQCSMLVTVKDLALMGATLANDGVNPVTQERALAADYVHDVLTVMNTCGMYNYAGQWSYDVGMPAKSGVSGSILAIIPGQAGVAIYSPPIDTNGNSVRGVAACKAMAADFRLHIFRTHPNSRTVIRREASGKAIRSKRVRSHAERALLDAQGDTIAVIEVQDALYFASAERLLRRAARGTKQAAYLILDLQRVYSADDAASRLLIQFSQAMSEGGRRLIFANLLADGPLAALRTELLQALPALSGAVFDSRDAALEWCENDLIAGATPSTRGAALDLADLDIFNGLTPAELALAAGAAKMVEFAKGDTIIKEGEDADSVFIVAQGTASVRIATREGQGGRSIRLGAMGPGMSFGEMALLNGGKRSADVIADEAVRCYRMPVKALKALSAEHPSVYIKMLSNITRDVSERLRLANSEIRALES